MEPYSKKTTLQIVALLSLLALVKGNEMSGSFQVCNLQCSNDAGETSHPITANSPTSRFLRGKSGPRGEKGARGDGGVKGDAGISCNISEIAEMKSQIARLESGLDNLRNNGALVHLLASVDKWKYCGAGVQVDPNTGTSEISDGQITASTYASDHYPYHGKLLSTVGHGAWCAQRNDGNQWIQVDFQDEKTLYGVATQGIQHKVHWTTSYKVAYQHNNEGFRPIVDESGAALVFHGNNDKLSVVTNRFPHPITARYIRIQVLTYYEWTCLRFELITC